MTILFAGSEPDSFKYDASLIFSTTENQFDPLYVRGGISVGTGTMATAPVAIPVSNDLWFHWDNMIPATNSAILQVEGRTAAGVPWFRILWLATSNSLQFEYWNGSDWTVVAGVPFSSLLQIFDVQYHNTVDGRIALYIDNNLIGVATGDFSAHGAVDRLVFVGRATNTFRISQVLIADAPTLGFKVAYRHPTANGTYTGWNGTFADIDDAIPVDASFISSGIADQRESFTKPIFNVPAGFRIAAVGATARARRGGTGPANLAFMLRYGSTDYDSADQPLELDFNPKQAFWHINPATALPWTPADAGSIAVEFGVKART